jgi:WD40 repeat protein
MRNFKLFLTILTVYLFILNVECFIYAQDRLVTTYETEPLIRDVYMAADGQTVVLVYDDRLEAWDITTGEKIMETSAPLFVTIPLAYSNTAQRIAWTHNGDYAAAVNIADNTISVYERNNPTPLYTIANADFRLGGVIWRFDGAIWVATAAMGNDQHTIRLHKAEDGSVVREITLDTEQYIYPASFYGLAFEPDGNRFAVGRLSGGTSEIRVYDSNTLEESVVVGEDEHYNAPGWIGFHWLARGILSYCIDPSLDGPEGDIASESVTHNLETDEKTHIPICVSAVSPDRRYGTRMNFDAEIEVYHLATGDVVDVLALGDLSETDTSTLSEVTYTDWSISGIIIYRGVPLTIWQPEIPD